MQTRSLIGYRNGGRERRQVSTRIQSPANQSFRVYTFVRRARTILVSHRITLVSMRHYAPKNLTLDYPYPDDMKPKPILWFTDGRLIIFGKFCLPFGFVPSFSEEFGLLH